MDNNEMNQYARLKKENGGVTQDLQNSAQAGLELAAALDRARAAAKALASTASRVKRVLSGFDQINRLGEAKKKSSSKKSQQIVVAEQTEQGPQPLTELPEKEISLFAATLGGIFDFSGIFEKLRDLGERLWKLWHEVLAPFCDWLFTTAAPIFAQHLVDGISAVVDWFGRLFDRAGTLWQQLQTGAEGILSGIVPALQQLGNGIVNLAAGFFDGCSRIGNDTQTMGSRVSGVAGMLSGALQGLCTGWTNNFAGVQTAMGSFGTAITNGLKGITDYLSGTFTQNWKDGFTGLKSPVKTVINSIIGFLNTMLSGLTGALNGVINAANKLKFTVPDWVPGIGGKQYGFSFHTVSVPQIPYLARGAVLPANRPFLAMVGDQRHGTNVEAPLATIQEAVAGVMADHTAGNMAGHEATVEVLHRILEAVLGLELGEAVVARAVQSHQMKNAVMKGGSF